MQQKILMIYKYKIEDYEDVNKAIENFFQFKIKKIEVKEYKIKMNES